MLRAGLAATSAALRPYPKVASGDEKATADDTVPPLVDTQAARSCPGADEVAAATTQSARVVLTAVWTR